MAKDSILKKIKLWFVFKYYRWFKKQVPYLYDQYTDTYHYMDKATYDAMGKR